MASDGHDAAGDGDLRQEAAVRKGVVTDLRHAGGDRHVRGRDALESALLNDRQRGRDLRRRRRLGADLRDPQHA